MRASINLCEKALCVEESKKFLFSNAIQTEYSNLILPIMLFSAKVKDFS